MLDSADDAGLTGLTCGEAEGIHPAWASNGASIDYVSDVDGDCEVYVMTASGGGVIDLTHNMARLMEPALPQAGVHLPARWKL